MDYKAKLVTETLVTIYTGELTSYSMSLKKLRDIMEECTSAFSEYKDIELSMDYGGLNGGFLYNGKGLTITVDGSRLETDREILVRNQKTLEARKETVIQLTKQIREICEEGTDNTVIVELKKEIATI